MPTSKAMEVASHVFSEWREGRTAGACLMAAATLIDQHTAQLVQEARNNALEEAANIADKYAVPVNGPRDYAAFGAHEASRTIAHVVRALKTNGGQ